VRADLFFDPFLSSAARCWAAQISGQEKTSSYRSPERSRRNRDANDANSRQRFPSAPIREIRVSTFNHFLPSLARDVGFVQFDAEKRVRRAGIQTVPDGDTLYAAWKWRDKK
jgi:hypothetical protein